MARARVLIVEDESALAELLTYTLEHEGYAVSHAAEAYRALECVARDKPDIIILDWMLPGLSGIDICRRVRRDPALRGTSILMLSARGEEEDRVSGLEAGADDYMPKPFSMKELVARLRALRRRAGGLLDADILRIGAFEIDKAAQEVRLGTQTASLGPVEFRLLTCMAAHPGRVFSRTLLLDTVWGANSILEERTVDVHISRLRKALKRLGGGDPVRTVRAAGYALAPPERPETRSPDFGSAPR